MSVRVGTLTGGGGTFDLEEFNHHTKRSIHSSSSSSPHTSTPTPAMVISSPIRRQVRASPSPPGSAGRQRTPTPPATNGTHRIVPQLPLHTITNTPSSSLTPFSYTIVPPIPSTSSSCSSSHPHSNGDFGVSGFIDGPFSKALFDSPSQLGLQFQNDTKEINAIYVADTGNHAIRKIDLQTKRVTTIACRTTKRPTQQSAEEPTTTTSSASTSSPPPAPTKTSSDKDMSANPFPLLLPLHSPSGLVLDPASSGAWLIVSDTGNHILRKITLQTSMTNGLDRIGKCVRFAGGGGETQAGISMLGETNEGDDTEEEDEEDEVANNGDENNVDKESPIADSSLPLRRRMMVPQDDILPSSLIRPSTSSGGVRPSTASSTKTRPQAPTKSSLSCRFSHPTGMCWDSASNLIVIDRDNKKLKSISTTGRIRTIVNTKKNLTMMTHGHGTIQTIQMDSRNNLLYTSSSSHALHTIPSSDIVSSSSSSNTSCHLLTGHVKSSGFIDSSISSMEVRLNEPYGIVCDTRSNLTFVTDRSNHAIRMVLTNGGVRTIGGGGGSDSINTQLSGSFTNRPPPTPTPDRDHLEHVPFEGYTNGSGSTSQFFHPSHMAIGLVQGVQTLFVVDSGNHCIRWIRMDDTKTSSNGGDDVDDGSSSRPSSSSSSSSSPQHDFHSLAPDDPFPSARIMMSHHHNNNQQNNLNQQRQQPQRPMTAGGNMNRHASMPSFHTNPTPLTSRPFTATRRPTNVRPSSSDRNTSSNSSSSLHAKAASSSIALSALSSLSPPPRVSSWSRTDVGFWLLSLGTSSSQMFEQYLVKFYEQHIDGESLFKRCMCEDSYLQQRLGITSKIHRKMIVREIMKLRATMEVEDEQQDEEEDEDEDTNDEDEDHHHTSPSSSDRSHTSSRVGSANHPHPHSNRSYTVTVGQPIPQRPQTAGGWRQTPTIDGPILPIEFEQNANTHDGTHSESDEGHEEE